MNQTVGTVLGWVALVAAVIAFFWQPYIMAGTAIILGLVGYFLKANTTRMSITAVGLGIVAILFASVTY